MQDVLFVLDVEGFRVAGDFLNDAHGLIMLWVALDLLEALLDVTSEEDYNLVCGALDLVVLEHDVGSVQVDCLVDDVLSRRVCAVRVPRRDRVDGHAASFLGRRRLIEL